MTDIKKLFSQNVNNPFAPKDIRKVNTNTVPGLELRAADPIDQLVDLNPSFGATLAQRAADTHEIINRVALMDPKAASTAFQNAAVFSALSSGSIDFTSDDDDFIQPSDLSEEAYTSELGDQFGGVLFRLGQSYLS